MSHNKNHAAGIEGCQVNDVQPDYMEVVPSRREAMDFAVSIFKGVDTSTEEVITAAAAIHQFLVGGLHVDLNDEYGKGLFPANNLAECPEKLKNVSADGYGSVNEFSLPLAEDAGASRSTGTDRADYLFVGAEEILLDWTPEKKSALRITLPYGRSYLNGFWVNLAGSPGILAHFCFLASVKGQMLFEADQWHLENGQLPFQPNPQLKLRGPFLKGKKDGI
mgnify:CR=1 FL=1